MKCRNCERVVVENASFCNYCGERTSRTCSTCDTVNPSDGLFCHHCGQALNGETQPSSQVPTDTQRGSTRPYESARTWANWTVGLLAATCVAYVIYVLITFNFLNMMEPNTRYFMSSGYSDPIQGRDIPHGLAIIATAVSFLMWNYRVSLNLRALGASGQRFTPSWAVAWWFVPIMFFFRPYQVMAEIWRGSIPQTQRVSANAWKDGPVAALLIWWWGLWLASNITDLISLALFPYPFEDYIFVPAFALWLDILSSVLGAAAGVLAIMVVRSITNYQDEKNRLRTGG